jgi:hypothetical protein
MKTIIKFRDPIYFVTYTFILKDWNLFLREMDKISKDYEISYHPDARMQFFGGRESHVFIYLKSFNLPTLAHEVAHAALAVFKSIGANVTSDNDENFAYYIQWIFGTIYHNIKR